VPPQPTGNVGGSRGQVGKLPGAVLQDKIGQLWEKAQYTWQVTICPRPPDGWQTQLPGYQG